ncbi:MAG: RecQ family ATP-dependent DNA helicase [Bacteroidia bacterium]|nr:RecQ family ATP-dependent DNA helicase [Bacteroidia bacterium]MDW8347034.1 ATP-dependent DNA helicase RecQ [Bacteroidia bacterium]
MKNPLSVLQEYWKYPEFRPLQAEIVQSVLDKYDTLAILPTGGGKSICYQVPILCLEGIGLVISPLIALIQDQVEQLLRRNIPAASIHSGLTQIEIEIILRECQAGKYRFLYCSPERLQSTKFIEKLKYLPISIIAVDEAHCISHWGYDFRPSYLKIADIRPFFPYAPVIALTASATPKVQQDITDKLAFKSNYKHFQKSFARDNLRYAALQEDNKLAKMLEIIQKVRGTGIVYGRTRKEVEEVFKMLKEMNLPVTYYHAGLSVLQREKTQQEWIKGEKKIIVATNAFGMGIDKPDVRYVIHYSPPADMEAYYQEAGRAGRDGLTSYAVILYRHNDLDVLKKWISSRFPDITTIKQAYQDINIFYQVPYYEYPPNEQVILDIDAIVQKFNQYSVPVLYEIIKQLEAEGYFTYVEKELIYSKVAFLHNLEDIYTFMVHHPKYDAILKTLFRLLGGTALEGRQQSIEESKVAQLAKLSIETVYMQLNELHKLNVIEYLRSTDKPFLRWLMPRVPPEDFVINAERYQNRKKWYLDKLEAMLNYVQNTTQCRMEYISQYFGEMNTKPCGKCDVCVGRHKKTLNQNLFDRIKLEVMLLVAQQPLSYDEVIKKINTGNPQQREQVLRYLIDNNEVKLSPDLKISL